MAEQPTIDDVPGEIAADTVRKASLYDSAIVQLRFWFDAEGPLFDLGPKILAEAGLGGERLADVIRVLVIEIFRLRCHADRREMAAATLTGLLPTQHAALLVHHRNFYAIAEVAVELADATLAALAKPQPSDAGTQPIDGDRHSESPETTNRKEAAPEP